MYENQCVIFQVFLLILFWFNYQWIVVHLHLNEKKILDNQCWNQNLLNCQLKYFEIEFITELGKRYVIEEVDCLNDLGLMIIKNCSYKWIWKRIIITNFCHSNIRYSILYLWFSQHHFLIFIFIIYTIHIKRIITIINRQFVLDYFTSFILFIRCGLFRRIYQRNQMNNYECCFDCFHCSLQSFHYILIIQYNSKNCQQNSQSFEE